MDTAGPRRLAALPGYDTAPDIYETPELTDDTSTTVPTSPRSDEASSATSEDDDDDEQDDGYGVSRRRLYPQRARERFGETSNRVEARGVDLSDRVDGKRKGYRVSRLGEENIEPESLEARIARLRREIEECKGQAEEQRTAQDEDNGERGSVDEVEELSRLLKSFETAKPARTARSAVADVAAEDAEPSDHTDDQVLSKVADFDARLAALERSLGISSLASATSPAVSTPLLPSLTLLDQQLSALTSATSMVNLEAASHRIDKLRRDAADLAAAQASARPSSANPNASTGSRPSSSASASQLTPTTLSHDDIDKLQGLYTLLPTLQTLAPTVPAMLDRLRSLRTLHATAASAAAALDQVEKRQAETQSELAEWRQGLNKVEAATREAEAGNGKNAKVVEAWVKDLEGRMERIGR